MIRIVKFGFIAYAEFLLGVENLGRFEYGTPICLGLDCLKAGFK